MTRDKFKTAMLDSLRMNRSVVFVMLAYIAFVLVLGRLAGFEVALGIYGRSATAVMLISFWLMLVAVVLFKVYMHQPERPVSYAWYLLMNDLRVVERVIIGLPCILLLPVFSAAFTSLKSAIAVVHPFHLDPLFARLDSITHGGHAWELIHPIVAYPLVTFFLNISYNIWLIILLFIFALVTIMLGNRELREQYLLSFFGCWILLGSLAAIGLSSVGPCYYALVYPTDPYAPLMSYLRSVNEIYPLWALSTQDMLWEQHISRTPGLGAGISAMPSLHLAIATLNALLLSRLSRTAGILGWAYVPIILIGSVHLGWHYAIDGYVSILAVLLIWRAAGWWVARGVRLSPVELASV